MIKRIILISLLAVTIISISFYNLYITNFTQEELIEYHLQRWYGENSKVKILTTYLFPNTKIVGYVLDDNRTYGVAKLEKNDNDKFELTSCKTESLMLERSKDIFNLFATVDSKQYIGFFNMNPEIVKITLSINGTPAIRDNVRPPTLVFFPFGSGQVTGEYLFFDKYGKEIPQN